ncbi:MAG: phenylalanine--tRNA ligase subunit beta [Gammaproteobacteria bacterium]
MRVNLEWLREWVSIDLEPAELAERLTVAGLEVSSVEAAAPDFEGPVVAEITGVQPHPDADRLVVCEVDDGRKQHVVVCGAPNATSGLRAPFAPVGAQLPGGVKIGRAKLRGVTSDGMLCSGQDLGLSEESDGLLELAEDAPLGESIRDHLRLDDAILDIELTPNRGDCFSVVGIAREVAATQGLELEPPANVPVKAQSSATFNVTLEAEAGCPRFVGRLIRGISITATSPVWLAERLRRAGFRAIHPVVDVTNYVMLELGQPLHSYDERKLDTGIVVRLARKREKLKLLDDREISLDPDVMVIADSSGAIGLAGIMGGNSTAVDAQTQDIFLEAAYFSPPAMAGRARRLGLQTDAATRFERGVDPENQARAIERATALLVEIVGGEPGPIVETKLSDHLAANEPILLRHDRLQAILGLDVDTESVEHILKILAMDVTQHKGGWRVTPPGFRFDLRIEEDLFEEVARMIGYDNIPVTPELSAGHLGTATESRVTEDRLADLLAARGYSEIISYSFVDEELENAINPGTAMAKLANPISKDLSVMRRSLWPGLLKTATQNLSRQQNRMRLFEMGAQFSVVAKKIVETHVLAGLVAGSRWPEHWDFDATAADFFDVKADIEAIFQLTGRLDELQFSPAEHPALRPGQTARLRLAGEHIGWLGALHPVLERRLELRTNVILFALRLEETLQSALPNFRAYSKFPSVRRDIAVVVDENISVDRIIESVRENAGDMLQNVMVFDVYRGKGIDSSLKSVALGLILQDTSRTLTDADADHTVSSVTEHLGRALGATIRT